MTKLLYVEHNDDNLYTLKTRLELLGVRVRLLAIALERLSKCFMRERAVPVLYYRI